MDQNQQWLEESVECDLCGCSILNFLAQVTQTNMPALPFFA
jgi:hypothetical protein